MSLKAVRCPRCRITLHEVPVGWRVWVLALPARDAHTGTGAVKHCFGKGCQAHTWLEIVEGPATAVTLRMTEGWMLGT